jgi:hypothetical protein
MEIVNSNGYIKREKIGNELPRPEAPPPKGGFLDITPALSNKSVHTREK